MVLSLRPGAVIPHITALHTQGPHCSDYREDTIQSYTPNSTPCLHGISMGVCAYVPILIYEHCLCTFSISLCPSLSYCSECSRLQRLLEKLFVIVLAGSSLKEDSYVFFQNTRSYLMNGIKNTKY